MELYIKKSALVAEIENLLDKGRYHEEYDCAYRDGNNSALYALKDKLDTLEVKEDKEMPTSGECVTLSKERYQELLEYESVALWAFNVIIVASLPSIEDEKLKEISDDVKRKAVQAAFQEALKNMEDKE